jgi:RNA polymerase sigma-70 factor (ECF subfamily)
VVKQLESIEEIYETYERLIFNYLYGLTLSFHLAEDLTQETFFQVVKSFHKFRGDSHVSTWLYKIARNVYNQHYRKMTIKTFSIDKSVFDIPDGNSPEEKFVEQEKNKFLEDILRQVPEKQREVLWLRDWQELSYAEIATIIGRSISWVKVNIHRGRLAFKRIYERRALGE